MKVTHIQLQSDSETVLEVATTTVPIDDKFYLRSSFGLDPDQIFPRYSGQGTSSGKKWYHFSRKAREVSLRVVLNPNYLLSESYSEIRDELYRSISANRSGLLDLVFYDEGAAVMKLTGFITKFEVPYSSETPELQLTLTCEDPMFKSVGRIYYDGSEINPGSEVIVSAGDATAPSGFCFQVTFTASTASFVMQDKVSDPDAIFSVTPDSDFDVGDKLYFCSEYKAKQLYMLDASNGNEKIHLVDAIDPGSTWPLLYPGMNTFFLADSANFDWDFVEFSKLYWGL